MRIAMFYQSLVSDWNHASAHFLRGVASELMSRGNRVTIYEPRAGSSRSQLVQRHGDVAVVDFHEHFPHLRSVAYGPRLDLGRALAGVDLVIVHDWIDPALVGAIGRHRATCRGMRALFHDTHHRAVTAPEAMGLYDLSRYDGVLTRGEVVSDAYRREGWARRVWTWHEAVDTRVFHLPRADDARTRDVIWVADGGDDDMTRKVRGFLLEPARQLGLSTTAYGVRHPESLRRALSEVGVEDRGWLADYRLPEAFAGHRVAVHIPCDLYAGRLPGIPTIRPFEALACGIPLISAAWEDCDGLFTPGADYLVARDGREMTRLLRFLMRDPSAAKAMAAHGHETILRRHTCGHRVDQLIKIWDTLAPGQPATLATSAVSRRAA